MQDLSTIVSCQMLTSLAAITTYSKSTLSSQKIRWYYHRARHVRKGHASCTHTLAEGTPRKATNNSKWPMARHMAHDDKMTLAQQQIPIIIITCLIYIITKGPT
jgi:hypothetical protein